MVIKVCIAHLSAEDKLKSMVIEEKKLKHSPRAGANNPLRPKFRGQSFDISNVLSLHSFVASFQKIPLNKNQK